MEPTKLGAAEAVSEFTVVPFSNDTATVGFVRDVNEKSLRDEPNEEVVGSWRSVLGVRPPRVEFRFTDKCCLSPS